MTLPALKMLQPASKTLAVRRLPAIARGMAAISIGLSLFTVGCPKQAHAAYTALYGSDGNDFYRFTGSSGIGGLKDSGWNGLLLFAASV